MDFFGQEPPKMNFEGRKTIKTRWGIFVSTMLSMEFLYMLIIHLGTMYGVGNYIDLDEYTLEEQDRGFSE